MAADRTRSSPRHRWERRPPDASERPDRAAPIAATPYGGRLARSADAGAAAVKLLRTIRLDASDTFVFDKAAEPGEWAVPGGFAFFNTDPETLSGKTRTAFRAGFLGTESLGWSTLVQVVDADEDGRATLVERLAATLVEQFRAPDIATARAAAEDEVAFAASLTDHPAGTLVAMHRACEDGAIRETFRTLRPRDGEKPLRAFAFMDVEGENDPDDTVDLVHLAKG